MGATTRLRSGVGGPTILTVLSRMVVLLIPGGLLLITSQRVEGETKLLVLLGAAFQLLVCVFTFVTRPAWRQPLGPSVVALYLIALGWLWLAAPTHSDWFLHLAKGFLLVVPLAVFAMQTLLNSGAPAVRKARLLADRIAGRREWPAEVAAIRELPEVKAFRAAVQRDATPALALLHHARVPVRVAALAAL